MLEGTGRNIRQASLRVSSQMGRLVAVENADEVKIIMLELLV